MSTNTFGRVFDACIVGAGPSGTAAAITLAKAGRSVIVVDKATFPRDKCCGDGLTAGALRLLESLGLDPAKVSSWTTVDDVIVRSPSGRTVTFPMPPNAGAYSVVARRVDLDNALVALARANGVTVVEDALLTSCVPSSNGVIVNASGHVIEARFVIGADGMWSPLRKLLAPPTPNEPTYLGEWHAFRQYFTGVTGRAQHEMFVFFERDLLPGYFWSFPLGNGTANLGFGIVRDGDQSVQHMKNLWPEILARPHISELLGPGVEAESPHKAWPIPARITAAVLSAAGGRALFVGDAASATDPMTGEGIGQALLTGTLAARAILRGAAPVEVANLYESSVHRHLSADHKLAALLSGWLRKPLLARGSLRVAGLNSWTRRNFGRWLFEDYPRAMLFTPRRWHRKMFTGQGSYQNR